MSTVEEISIINVVAVIISAFFAIESAAIVAFIAKAVKTVLKTKENPKLIELKKQIRELKTEMNGISPTSQFAAYFKKDRLLNKLNDEVAEIESQSSSENQKAVKIEGVVRVVIQLSALVLLRYVSSITAFCIPDNLFFPINFLVRFPAIFGNDSCPNEFAEVSGFAIAFFSFHLLSIFIKYLPIGSNKEKTT